jgi:hypothetical protein
MAFPQMHATESGAERHEPGRPKEVVGRGGGAHYRALFTNSPLPKALSRASDSVRVDCTDAFRRLFELSVEDSVGKTSLEQGLVDAQNAAEIARRFAERGSFSRCEGESAIDRGEWGGRGSLSSMQWKRSTCLQGRRGKAPRGILSHGRIANGGLSSG